MGRWLQRFPAWKCLVGHLPGKLWVLLRSVSFISQIEHEDILIRQIMCWANIFGMAVSLAPSVRWQCWSRKTWILDLTFSQVVGVTVDMSLSLSSLLSSFCRWAGGWDQWPSQWVSLVLCRLCVAAQGLLIAMCRLLWLWCSGHRAHGLLSFSHSLWDLSSLCCAMLICSVVSDSLWPHGL